jgi:hypothetical protein
MWFIKRPRANPYPRILALPVALGVLFAMVLGGVALAQGTTFTGCLDAKGTLGRVAIGTEPAYPCKQGEQEVSWNEQGPAGPPGSGGATVATLELETFGNVCPDDTDYHTIGSGCPGGQFATAGGEITSAEQIDPVDYPTGATATLWTVMRLNPNDGLCMRLFDLTTQVAVPNSEVCLANSTNADQISRASASPIDLQADSVWVLQVKHQNVIFMGSSSALRAQLVIDWE